jgi:S-adenosylmethionine decarboxylase proenzyme
LNNRKNNNSNDDGWVPCESNACSRGKENKPASRLAALSLQFQPNANSNDDDLHNDDSDGLHLPAGQHLLVDIKDVDSNFLNSEERLATAMIELINESKLTLLSYHCHSLVPIGVSCAGVLLESHVAFHTWPLEGVITMDLFTCGGGLLIPTLPSIEKLFGVPSEERNGDEESVPQPTMLWSHKLRGFREGFAPGYVRSNNPLDGSLGRYVLGKLDFDVKHPLLSTKTAYQSVNIYEVMEPTFRNVHSYHKSVRAEDEGGKSYESSHPEHFGPDKVLFLDGILQSTLFGDAPYHESIVHPAMITSTNPKRVAIIGGGEGATLREVLKYKSVREVVILEIDEDLIKICAQYMPEWSDCSDIEGSNVTSCFDDSRATMVIGDAIKWFTDNFVDNVENAAEEKKFDVIIMDALDTGGLYNNTSFVNSLFYGLSADGVVSLCP